jgi:hypothetical protein
MTFAWNEHLKSTDRSLWIVVITSRCIGLVEYCLAILIGSTTWPSWMQALRDLPLPFNGKRVRTRSVVIATGARYGRLDVPNLEDYEATSVHHWASRSRAN